MEFLKNIIINWKVIPNRLAVNAILVALPFIYLISNFTILLDFFYNIYAVSNSSIIRVKGFRHQ